MWYEPRLHAYCSGDCTYYSLHSMGKGAVIITVTVVTRHITLIGWGCRYGLLLFTKIIVNLWRGILSVLSHTKSAVLSVLRYRKRMVLWIKNGALNVLQYIKRALS